MTIRESFNEDAKDYVSRKEYCVQNGDCSTCSLVNYGRDCRNNPVDEPVQEQRNKECILSKPKKDIYEVFDEMAMQELLKTENEAEARAMAYNHQCVLKLNGIQIHDYSCDW